MIYPASSGNTHDSATIQDTSSSASTPPISVEAWDGPISSLIDIKRLQSNPTDFDAGLRARGVVSPPLAQDILDDYEHYGRLQQELEQLRRQKKELARWSPNLTEDEKSERILKAKALDEDGAEQAAARAKKKVLDALLVLPNPWVQTDVPRGTSDQDNQEVFRWQEQPAVSLDTFQDHASWAKERGYLNTDQAALISGARFHYLKGPLARLERALGQWMLDVQTQHFGFIEMSVPYLVKQKGIFGAGQWPKFQEDLFQVAHHTHPLYLISTAEVSLVNWAADTCFPSKELPLCLAALTPCFRAEAGASGKDTQGLLRQHQFHKVELVVICRPQDTSHWHNQLRHQAEYILQALELPYRTMVLCTGDMGPCSEKTFDLEVWVPSQGCYREIASCSQCGDYQARRLQAKFDDENGKREYVHTLNSSGLPTGRTLLAILENHRTSDGRVLIPEVLRSYMGNMAYLD